MAPPHRQVRLPRHARLPPACRMSSLLLAAPRPRKHILGESRLLHRRIQAAESGQLSLPGLVAADWDSAWYVAGQVLTGSTGAVCSKQSRNSSGRQGNSNKASQKRQMPSARMNSGQPCLSCWTVDEAPKLPHTLSRRSNVLSVRPCCWRAIFDVRRAQP